MELSIVHINVPENVNIIVGQAHFIKTVEDVYEAIVNCNPNIEFGIAFCEASGKRLVRIEGNDKTLIKVAADNAMNIGAGHIFVIVLKNGYPINVLNAIKNVPEVCRIYCATANPLEVIVAHTKQGRGIIGIVDGFMPDGIESDEDIEARKKLLRNIKYKL